MMRGVKTDAGNGLAEVSILVYLFERWRDGWEGRKGEGGRGKGRE